MVATDRKKFAALMAVLAEVWGGEATENRIKIYFEALEDFTIERVEKCFREIVKNRTVASFPKPAELRQAVEGTLSDRAALAILAIRRAAFTLGAYVSVEFEDQAIMVTIARLGGWIYLCREFEWQYRTQEFQAAFEAVCHEDPYVNPVKYLVGVQEAENSKSFPTYVKPPVRIGKTGNVLPGLSAGEMPKQIQEVKGEK